jgi:hypothetical protein
MSTVRIQLRRGLEADWTSADTALNSSGGLVLAGGEVGLETDTGKFKFGDGTTRWSVLPYALENTLGDYVLLADVGQPNGVASLNSSGKVPAAQLDISELSQDAVNTALIAGTGLDKTYNDNANTITLDIDSTVATKQFAAELLTNATKSNITITGNENGLTISAENGVADSTTDNLTEGSTNKYFTDERAQDAVNGALVAGSNITKSYDDNANTITLNLQEEVSLTTSLEAPTVYTDNLHVYDTATVEDLIISGNLTFNGTATQINSVDLVVTDPLIYIGEDNQSNTLDLGLVASFNNGTYQHTGLVKDATDGTWRLFSGVTTEPTTTVDFTTYTKDNLQVGGLSADSATIGDVSNTEIQFLNGVTDNVQTQINAKLDSSTAASTYSPLSSPTFTGTVVLPINTSIADVSSTEISYLNGVTSGIQAQIDAKAPTNSPTFTGTVSGVTKAMVGLGLVDNTSDSDKPISSATQTSLNLKAPVLDPTFTGTVVLPALTSIGDVSSVEIGYVNGVTSGIQAQLDGKSNDGHSHTSSNVTDFVEAAQDAIGNSIGSGLSYNDSTGAISVNTSEIQSRVSGVSDTEIGYLDGVTSNIQNQINDKAPISSPTFTGTVSGVTKAHVGLANVDNTSDANKPVSTATQTELDLKAPLNNPTFTGTVTLPANTISQSMMSDNSVGTNEIGGLAVTTEKIADLAVTEGKIADSAVTSAKIANGTIVNADINASAAIDKTKISGTAITAGDTGTVTSTMIADGTIVNGDINAAAGIDWTKLAISSSVSATELGYVDGVTSAIQTQLNARLPLAGGTMTGALTLSGAPSADLHAATKAYVDNVVSGLNFHQPVRVATTANITLSGTQTIDGVSVVVGDRVLAKDQTDQKTNGIYVVAASTWSRATDADNTPDGELKGGDFTLVLEGTNNSGYGYVCSNTSAISIGTTNITYAEFSAGKTVVAGSGLTEATPGTISVATGGITSGMIADGAIVNADINASAAIALSKLASGTSGQIIVANSSGVPAWVSETGDVTISDTGVTAISSGVIVDADVNASAAIAQSKISGLTTDLAAKAPLAGPTFTGTVVLPSTTSIGNVTSTEIGYVDGVTSAIQTQIDSKLATATASSTYAPIASPTFTGTVTVAASGVAFTDGTQTKEGVASRTPIVQKTAAYTLSALTHRDSLIEVSSATGVTVSIPTDATLNYPIGTSIDILQTGAGQVTIAAVTPGTTTVNATPGLKLRTQWSSATLFKRAANTWVVYGDLTA